MSELCARLETIGIGQYGDAFDANESGTDLLEQVDDQLLKDIGVSIGGQIILARALMAAKSGYPRAGGDVCPHTTALWEVGPAAPLGPTLIGQWQHRLV
jgi:hypothetical protein